MQGYRKKFSTQGRIGRWGYFLHTIMDVCFVALSIALTFFLSVALGIETNLWVLGLLLVFICVLGALLEFFASIHRLHDIGLSGWWLLLSFVPFANLLLALVLLFKPGDPETNHYGPSPHV